MSGATYVCILNNNHSFSSPKQLSPSLSTTEDTSSLSKDNPFKDFLSKIFGIELFNMIIDSKISDVKLATKWISIGKEPSQVYKEINVKPYLEIKADSYFNGARYI